MAYLPGQEGGRALADVIFGDFNPCGKLPFTYPKSTGSIWAYDHLRSDERDINFDYDGFNPQYEFGFGLSYTNFEYSNLIISQDTLKTNEYLEVKVDVTNTGDRSGKEVVQLFVSDLVASISPAVKQLKRFTKIHLQPTESETITFNLSAKDLGFVNQQNKWVTEPGEFKIAIDTLSTNFIYK